MWASRLSFKAISAALEQAAGNGAGAATLRHAIPIFDRAITLSETFEELERVVERLSATDFIPDLKLLLKLYVVGWSTLSDLVAGLLNDAFDLGYGDQDISMTALLRNAHIRVTAIPNLVRRHSNSLQHARFSKLRNDLVHRGQLRDEALVGLQSRWSDRVTQHVLAAVVAAPSDAAGDAQAKVDNAVAVANRDPQTALDIREFAAAKVAELRSHLDATTAFLNELDDTLAAIIRARITA